MLGAVHSDTCGSDRDGGSGSGVSQRDQRWQRETTTFCRYGRANTVNTPQVSATAHQRNNKAASNPTKLPAIQQG